MSHAGGNCPNKNLIESINDDSITPKGKACEKRWRPTLAQRVIAGRGPFAGIWTVWGTLVWKVVMKKAGASARSGMQGIAERKSLFRNSSWGVQMLTPFSYEMVY